MNKIKKIVVCVASLLTVSQFGSDYKSYASSKLKTLLDKNPIVNKEKKIKEIELIFIIDSSGSMTGSEDKVLKGFTNMVKEQQSCDDGRNVRLTTVLFNTERKVLHNQVDIQGVSKLTGNDYTPSGCTALLDAVGHTIKSINDSGKDKYLICVIITDGEENSSTDFSQKQIKDLIKEKESQGNWKFLYYMSGIDLNEKTDIGVDHKNCIVYESSSKSPYVMYDIMVGSSDHILDTRASLR